MSLQVIVCFWVGLKIEFSRVEGVGWNQWSGD